MCCNRLMNGLTSTQVLCLPCLNRAPNHATILEDYDFVDNPDGQIPGVVNVHAIRYGYLDCEQVTFSNTSARMAKHLLKISCFAQRRI